MPTRSEDAQLHKEIRRTGFELQHKQDTMLKSVDLHHHDFYEIYFLLSGEVTVTIESRLYRVTPGSVLLISPKELHQLQIFAEREIYERYVLWVDPKTLRRLSTEKTDLLQGLEPTWPGYHNLLLIPPEVQSSFYGLIARLHQELHAEAYGADVLAQNLLTELLVAINRIALRRERPEEDASLSSQVVSEAVAYIGLHYGEPLTLEELADRFYVSKYHLSHEFSRLMGTSVHRYILKKRLLIARQLMAQGKHPGEVWEECGFGDYTGFYRTFTAEYGLSPRDYAAAAPLEQP